MNQSSAAKGIVSDSTQSAPALAALAALLAPAIPLVPVWIIASLAALATAAVWTPERISRVLRLLGAVLVGLIPVVHAARHGAAIADPAAWIINAILVACAVAMGVSLLRPLRAPGLAAPIHPAE